MSQRHMHRVQRFGRYATTLGVVAVVAAFTGCGGTANHGAGGGATGQATTGAGTTAQGGENGGTTQPGSQQLSSSDYRRLLSTQAKNARAAIRKIEQAGTYNGLGRATKAARAVIGRVADRLGSATPPDEASAAHDVLVRALGMLADNLASTVDAIQSRSLCAAPSVSARLSQLQAARALHNAQVALRRVGYAWPALLPTRQAMPDRRLPTGSVLLRRIASGPGQLTVDNGLVVDGVISLVPKGTKRPVLSFAVRAHSSHTITNIGDGTYRIYFTAGRDWDPELRAFTRKCQFEVFDDPLAFTTQYDVGHYHYRSWQISLNPVVGGTATTSPVSPGGFPTVR